MKESIAKIFKNRLERIDTEFTQKDLLALFESELEQHKKALVDCAYELSSIIGLHGDETEAAKLEKSAALRSAKKLLGKSLVLNNGKK